MNLKSHKLALIAMALTLLLIIMVAFLASAWPKQEDCFFELGLLGKNKTADAYFGNDNSTVATGELNTWSIYVYNRMSVTQNIIVRVKLVNSSMALPDDFNHQPSQGGVIRQFPMNLSVNQTVIFPFWWKITSAETKDNSTKINSLKVNEDSVQVNISDQTSTFTLVIELWIKTQNAGDYIYGWQAKDGFHSASVFMGFKVLN